MKQIVFYAFIFTFITSCTEESVIENEVSFYGLKIGNSWVYKSYKYNLQTDDYLDTGVIDSVSVIGIENISNEKYYKIRTKTTGNENNITFCNPNGEYFELIRDSLGYLINNHGKVKFTNSNYNERVLKEESWGSIYETLSETNIDITVEAGIFNCIYSERYAKSTQGELLPAIDRFYYSEGIGLIYDTTSWISQDTPEIIRRLDSYVNN